MLYFKVSTLFPTLFPRHPLIQFPGQQNGIGDLAHRPAGIHALALHEPERLLFGNLPGSHEQALRALDRLPDRQGFLHFVTLPCAVNFAALETRFSRIWRDRNSSPHTFGRPGSTS